MDIRIAEHAGFCFGVKRATGELERAISEAEEGRKVYTLGKIIHNEHYTDSLRSLGVEEVSRGDIPAILAAADRGDAITLVIRAHGELEEIMCALREAEKRNPAFRLLDCTCPYVRKVRQIALENSGEDKLFVLLGNEKHPEVEGILSCAEGETLVLADSADTERYLETPKSEKNCGKHVDNVWITCGYSVHKYPA